eukprot:813256-Prymnesium_polylepis.2
MTDAACSSATVQASSLYFALPDSTGRLASASFATVSAMVTSSESVIWVTKDRSAFALLPGLTRAVWVTRSTASEQLGGAGATGVRAEKLATHHPDGRRQCAGPHRGGPAWRRL